MALAWNSKQSVNFGSVIVWSLEKLNEQAICAFANRRESEELWF